MRYWKRIVILIILLALGFALGWYMEGTKSVQSPVTEEVGDSAPVVTRQDTTGYCCITLGAECVLTPNAGECFMAQGEVFNSNQELCNSYCLSAKP